MPAAPQQSQANANCLAAIIGYHGRDKMLAVALFREAPQRGSERMPIAQERNAAIQEASTRYDFLFKMKRLEKQRQMAQKDVEVCGLREA